MCFLQCITRKYGGYFLEHLAVKLGYKGATLARLLKVKGDYRGSLNFILTVMEALVLSQIKAFCDYIDIDQSPLKDNFYKLKNIDFSQEKSDSFVRECLDGLKPFQSEFMKFIGKLGEKSENHALVNSFVWDECSTLLQLLNAIQTGSIGDRNLAMKRMIPHFFAMDR